MRRISPKNLQGFIITLKKPLKNFHLNASVFSNRHQKLKNSLL
jgi:hypothetical protein